MNNLVNSIIKKTKCVICGGPYKNGECMYCGNIDKDVVDQIEKLTDIINQIDTFDLDLLKEIFKVKDLSDKIDNILKEKNIYDVLNKKEDELVEKITTQGYLDDESSKYIQFFSVNASNIDKRIFFSTYVIMSNVIKKNHYEKEDYEDTIKSFATSFMNKQAFNAEFKIVDFNEENCEKFLGTHEYNGNKDFNTSIISIDRDELDKMYEGKSLNGLETIFHELTHLSQNTVIKAAEANNTSIMHMVKDFVLSSYLPEYYNINYTNISFEIDAELSANKMVLAYLDDWEVNVPNRFLIEKTIIDYQERFMKNTRIYNNKKYDLDELFDKFFMSLDNKIKDKIISEYPQINILYSFDGKEYHKRNNELIKLTLDTLTDSTGERYNNYIEQLNEKKR